MTNADMIKAMARAIGPGFIGNRMPDMSGDPLRKATPYERRRIDEAVTAALAVVQPELDRLRALVETLHMQAEAHAQEARTANATIREAYQAVTGSTGEPGSWNGARPIRDELDRLRAENEALRRVVTDALTVLKFAFNRIHVLPRSRDTELANDIDKVLGRLRAALSAPARDGEGR